VAWCGIGHAGQSGRGRPHSKTLREAVGRWDPVKRELCGIDGNGGKPLFRYDMEQGRSRPTMIGPIAGGSSGCDGGVRAWAVDMEQWHGDRAPWLHRTFADTCGLYECALFVVDGLGGAFAQGGVEDFFAESQVFRCGFDELVAGDVFEGTFERHFQGWLELDAFAVALAAHVGEVLGLGGVDRHVLGARVFADDHALVHFFARPDEHASAFLDVVERPGGGDAGFHGDEGAAEAGEDFADHGAVFLEHVAHDAAAAGEVDHVGFEPDQAAGGDDSFEVNTVRQVVHVGDLGFASGEHLHHVAETFAGHLDPEGFVGFEGASVLGAEDDFGTGDEDLVAFASHLFDEDGDLHFAAGADEEDVGRVAVAEAQGDVGADFFFEAFADVAGGDEFAVAAGEGAVVDAELHLDGGRVDVGEGDGLPVFVVAEGLADGDFLEAGDADDVAGDAGDGLGGFEAAELDDLGDGGAFASSVLVDADDGIADVDFAAGDFADGDASDVIGPVEVADEHLERAGFVGDGRRHVLDDGLEEGCHVAGRIADVFEGVPVAGAGVDEGGVELVLGGMEFEEQFEDFVVDLVRVGVFAVDFVDDDDDFEAVVEGFAQDEPGLGLGAVECVHEQQDAVDHLHDAFDFAAEVGVAGGIDDVDGDVFPVEGGVFGLDGDAFFFFEVHRVHGAFFHGLVGAVHAAFAQQFVHERGFAVVNVGDNADIANLAVHGNPVRWCDGG
jgi:hypothetical protein